MLLHFRKTVCFLFDTLNYICSHVITVIVLFIRNITHSPFTEMLGESMCTVSPTCISKFGYWSFNKIPKSSTFDFMICFLLHKDVLWKTQNRVLLTSNRNSQIDMTLTLTLFFLLYQGYIRI